MMIIYMALAFVLHLEVSNCPFILLPLLIPKEDVAIIDVYQGADND